MDIGTLLSYHKAEGSEETTYISIFLTVLLALFGYVGGAKKIDKSVRWILSLLFLVFSFFIISSIHGSMKIHDALHEEIKLYAKQNPTEFIKGNSDNSRLYQEFIKLEDHPKSLIYICGIILTIVMILGLLSIGEGKVIDFKKLIRRFKVWLFIKFLI